MSIRPLSLIKTSYYGFWAVVIFTICAICGWIAQHSLHWYEDFFRGVKNDGIHSYRIISIIPQQYMRDTRLLSEITRLAQAYENNNHAEDLSLNIECWVDNVCLKEDREFFQHCVAPFASIHVYDLTDRCQSLHQKGLPLWIHNADTDFEKNLIKLWAIDSDEDCNIYIEPQIWRLYDDRSIAPYSSQSYGVGSIKKSPKSFFVRIVFGSPMKNNLDIAFVDNNFLLAKGNSADLKFTQKIAVERDKTYGAALRHFAQEDQSFFPNELPSSLREERANWFAKYPQIPIQTNQAISWVCGPLFLEEIASSFALGGFYKNMLRDPTSSTEEYFPTKYHTYEELLFKAHGDLKILQQSFIEAVVDRTK